LVYGVYRNDQRATSVLDATVRMRTRASLPLRTKKLNGNRARNGLDP
jgi:hypothetical protein